MNLACPNCGSQSVQKVTAVVSAGWTSGGSYQTGAIHAQTDLSARLSPPRPLGCGFLLQALVLSAGTGGCLGLLIGVGVGAVGLAFVPILHSVDDTRFLTTAALFAGVVGFLWVLLGQWKVQNYFSHQRLRRARLKTYDREWYCHTCDRRFLPDDPTFPLPQL